MFQALKYIFDSYWYLFIIIILFYESIIYIIIWNFWIYFLSYNKSINIIPIIVRLNLLEIARLFLLVSLISSSGSKNLILIIIFCYLYLINLSFWFLHIILEIYVLEKSTNCDYTSLAQTVSAAKKTNLPLP
jgi:hypothetical protein